MAREVNKVMAMLMAVLEPAVQAKFGAAHIGVSQRTEFNKEAASHCPGEERGAKRAYGKERLHKSMRRKIGNCDTLCQRKYAEKHSTVEKHRFQGDESYTMRHCTGEGRTTWMRRNDP